MHVTRRFYLKACYGLITLRKHPIIWHYAIFSSGSSTAEKYGLRGERVNTLP